MKTFTNIILIFFLSSVLSYAQPQAINYQGVARDNAGHPLVNQIVGIRLSILDGSNMGPSVYSETHAVTTSASGLFNLSIGTGTVLSGTFATIPWGQGDKWLQIEMAAALGNNYQLVGTTQFLSAPYALNAANGNFNKTGNDIYNSNSGNVAIGTNSPNASAQLEITSTTKGLLPPRMTYAQRNGIINPATGLIVWCIDCYPTGELQVYNGTRWTNMTGGVSLALLPTISTTAISSITNASAISGGNITLDGGTAIIERGVCWNTIPNPTISLSSKTSDGTGLGIFTSNITGLTAGTNYYLRSYATNLSGTSYGNEFNFTTSPHAIGLFFQGGIIAYILQPGDPGYDPNVTHGLIAAPYDQYIGAEWGCFGTQINGADGSALGTGNQNTIDIVNGCPYFSIAARICADLVLNGYNDWYLPSSEELNKLLFNRIAIGGFIGAIYWSSTEINFQVAFYRNFGNGSFGADVKGATYVVRAVRSF